MGLQLYHYDLKDSIISNSHLFVNFPVDNKTKDRDQDKKKQCFFLLHIELIDKDKGRRTIALYFIQFLIDCYLMNFSNYPRTGKVNLFLSIPKLI